MNEQARLLLIAELEACCEEYLRLTIRLRKTISFLQGIAVEATPLLSPSEIDPNEQTFSLSEYQVQNSKQLPELGPVTPPPTEVLDARETAKSFPPQRINPLFNET